MNLRTSGHFAWRRRQTGFTLVELMIALAIASILAAVAIYVYQDYPVRARASEALAASAVARTAVIDNATANTGDFSHGYVSPGATENVSSIAIEPTTGVITATLAAAAGGGTLVFIPYTGSSAAPAPLVAGVTPDGIIQWRCRADGSSFALGPVGTLKARYAPAECR